MGYAHVFSIYFPSLCMLFVLFKENKAIINLLFNFYKSGQVIIFFILIFEQKTYIPTIQNTFVAMYIVENPWEFRQ